MNSRKEVLDKLVTEITDSTNILDVCINKIIELESTIGNLNARIDELMLEYVPEDMSREQLDEYEKHQRPITLEAAIERLNKK